MALKGGQEMMYTKHVKSITCPVSRRFLRFVVPLTHNDECESPRTHKSPYSNATWKWLMSQKTEQVIRLFRLQKEGSKHENKIQDEKKQKQYRALEKFMILISEANIMIVCASVSFRNFLIGSLTVNAKSYPCKSSLCCKLNIFQIWINFTYFHFSNEVLFMPSELERGGPFPGAVLRREFLHIYKQALQPFFELFQYWWPYIALSFHRPVSSFRKIFASSVINLNCVGCIDHQY